MYRRCALRLPPVIHLTHPTYISCSPTEFRIVYLMDSATTTYRASNRYLNGPQKMLQHQLIESIQSLGICNQLIILIMVLLELERPSARLVVNSCLIRSTSTSGVCTILKPLQNPHSKHLSSTTHGRIPVQMPPFLRRNHFHRSRYKVVI